MPKTLSYTTRFKTLEVKKWLLKDTTLYRLCEANASCRYNDFVTVLARAGYTHTPEGTRYASRRVSRRELNHFLASLS